MFETAKRMEMLPFSGIRVMMERANQMQKNAATVVEGENLDLLIANRPLSEDESLTKGEKELVKANVLKLLADTYQIAEEDFASAELEIVPAGKAYFYIGNVTELRRVSEKEEIR